MSLRIGIYASAMASERGHERNVSAHIQLPVHTMRLLHDAGHEVHLITNRFGDEHTLPAAIPEAVNVHLVDDGRRRPKLRRGGGNKKGLRPLGLVRQVAQLRGLSGDLDVLHFFGLARTAVLGGAVAALRPHCPVVATLVAGNLPPKPGLIARTALKRLGAIVSGTEWAANQVRALGLDVTLLRHGIIRDLVREYEEQLAGGEVEAASAPRHRVLFWRDPNEMNGADVCVEAFDRLAGEYPNHTFDLAIRPTRSEVPGIDSIAATHTNVHVHRFPYPDGVSLPKLMAESVLVVLPFRRLTVDPQLAIAESLDAGVPVISTAVRSTPELIVPGETGLVIPPGDVGALVEAVRRMLDHPAELAAMGRTTRDRFREKWNWTDYVSGLEEVYANVVD